MKRAKRLEQENVCDDKNANVKRTVDERELVF